ncbi:unnamed protein product, partial [Staurois parvus]
MPVSATYQCCQSVPPISASQCRLSCQSVAYQCGVGYQYTVPPNSATVMPISVPYMSLPFSAHQ